MTAAVHVPAGSELLVEGVPERVSTLIRHRWMHQASHCVAIRTCGLQKRDNNMFLLQLYHKHSSSSTCHAEFNIPMCTSAQAEAVVAAIEHLVCQLSTIPYADVL
jgi:hypothetical protein